MSSNNDATWCSEGKNLNPSAGGNLVPTRCYSTVNSGSMDTYIGNVCGRDSMHTPFCKDIYTNPSFKNSPALKAKLTDNWCKVNNNLNSRAGELPVPTQCYSTVNSGIMDDYLGNICDRDSMPSPFCKDVYTNTNLKLNTSLKTKLTDNWCKVNNNLNPGDLNAAVVPPQCYPTVTSGSMDTYITKQCTPANMGTKFCNDIYANPSYTLTSNLRNVIRPNAGSYCANDNTITTPACSIVYNDCTQTNAAFDDTTVPYYKCNSLIKNLQNETIKKQMLSKSDLSKLDANLSTYQKKSIISGFNNVGSSIVEESLCKLANNLNDPSCVSFQSNNFSNLINTNDENPVLVMYFIDDGSKTPFATPAGIDFTSSLSITSFPNNLNYFNTPPKYSLTPLWYAKFYVYLSPSTLDDYLFSVKATTDAKVYLNNTLIINAWNDKIPTVNTERIVTSSSFLSLSPKNGPYLLYIEYRNITPTVNIEISYTAKSTPFLSNKLNLDSILKQSSPSDIVKTSPYNPPQTAVPTLWISKFNPFLLAQTAQEIQSINYCTTNNNFATDVLCKGDAANSFNAINKSYTSNIKNPNNIKFQNTMLDYCSDPKYDRFATDNSFCNSADFQSYLLKPTNGSGVNEQMKNRMKEYCSMPVNNQYATSGSQNYCRTTDNINNTLYTANGAGLGMMTDYADSIRNGRMKYMSEALQNSLSSNPNNRPITQDVLDYLTIDYPNIQKNLSLANDANVQSFNQNIVNYCSDPKYNRFATDTIYCNNPIYKKNILNAGKDSDSTLLNSMGNYCLIPENQTYCRAVDKENNKNYTATGSNLPMNIKYADTVRTNRFNYIQNSINDIIKSNSNIDPDTIDSDILNYISTDYPEIQANAVLGPLYPNDKLLNSNIYPYCENTKNYKKNKLCNTVYNTYASDPNIQASIGRINDFNYGISSNAFMGKSDNSIANSTYINARDSPDSFAKYLPYAINYCNIANNIVTPECQDYYNKISNTINNGLDKDFKMYSSIRATQTSPSTIKQIEESGQPKPISTVPSMPTPVLINRNPSNLLVAMPPPSEPTTVPTPTTVPPTTPPISGFSNRQYDYDYDYDCDYDNSNESKWLYHIILFLCLVTLITMVMKLVKCKQRNRFSPPNGIFEYFKF